MILKRVKLQNFQSHKDTVIELAPGVNVIVGDTDQGKSAIIRGIKWAIRNRASAGFWNMKAEEAGEECLVGLAIDMEGREARIVRKRTKAGNFYVVIDGEDRQEFTGFAREVPEPVRRMVGTPVSFGKDLSYDFNISPQVEMPFLLSENPRNFARVLGKLTGIDVLDTAEQMVGKDDKRFASERKTLMAENEKVKNSLDALPDPVVAERLVDQAEKLEREADRLQNDSDALWKGVYELREGQEDMKGAQAEITTLEGHLEPLQNAHEKLSESATVCEALYQKKMALRRLGLAINSRVGLVDGIPEIGTENLDDREITLAKILSLDEARHRIRNARSDILVGETELEEIDGNLTEAREQLKGLLGETCPLSGGTLFEECRELIEG